MILTDNGIIFVTSRRNSPDVRTQAAPEAYNTSYRPRWQSARRAVRQSRAADPVKAVEQRDGLRVRIAGRTAAAGIGGSGNKKRTGKRQETLTDSLAGAQGLEP